MDQQFKAQLVSIERRCGFQVMGAEAELIEGHDALRNRPLSSHVLPR